jgi:hypothetical protein
LAGRHGSTRRAELQGRGAARTPVGRRLASGATGVEHVPPFERRRSFCERNGRGQKPRPFQPKAASALWSALSILELEEAKSPRCCTPSTARPRPQTVVGDPLTDRRAAPDGIERQSAVATHFVRERSEAEGTLVSGDLRSSDRSW